MSFSADWLALRAPADAAARDDALAAAAIAHAMARAGEAGGPVEITDLGAGTGATVRALAPLVSQPVHFKLVDADAALLDTAQRELAGREGCRITTLTADLVATPAPWRGRPHLVTASAFFDLVSARWIDAFCERLAADRLALYAALTFDGALRIDPPHPEDGAMVEAFHAHQHGDKGFGPAAGPDAASDLAQALEARGYSVATADSPWRLAAPRDGALIAELLDGWANAAREIRPDPAPIDAWRAAHASARTVLVGHTDLFAAPPD